MNPSITKRVTPDVSLFAAGGSYWGHAIVVCDSGNPSGGQECTSPDTFGYAGGTSFAAPQFAGILGLLKTGTGSRKGLVQPTLYALAERNMPRVLLAIPTARLQIPASRPACLHPPASSMTSLPAATATNAKLEPPTASTNPGASYGVLTSSGDNSTFVDACAAGAKYDIATGLGSVNVTNLITKWNTAFSSSTSL